MSGRVRTLTAYRQQVLSGPCELASTAAQAITDPADPQFQQLQWTTVRGCGTVAAMLRSVGVWSLDGPERALDAEDWWYRIRFAAAHTAQDAHLLLVLEGVATIAQLWLNGTSLLRSDNMFLAHEIPVDEILRPENELLLCVRALQTSLSAKRPRPRWRVPMIAHQRLNAVRTTLLGRTPGWSPPAAPVGPWRPIRLETRTQLRIGAPKLQSTVRGSQGELRVVCDIAALADVPLKAVTLRLRRAEREWHAKLERTPGGDEFGGRVVIDDVELWWPHTHGTPALYESWLEIEVGTECVRASLGYTGFRQLEVNTRGGDFAVSINSTQIFCRGACWMPLDVVSLQSPEAALEAALDQVVAAGFNMLRVSGATVYESDAFLDGCDRRGILLWQDYMFANMEYPRADHAFESSARLEARQLLERLSGRPCLTVLCGNSEAEQQAAMWGVPRDVWEQDLFYRVLPELSAELAPGVCYWPSSAHGGAFPHQTDQGTVSYYGVGAYLRPLPDARRAAVRFATECLALANVPEGTLDGEPPPRVHTAAHKARVPRDLGAGWDFEDVRDFYLRELFAVDPLALRYSQHDRYLLLSRIVSGELMARTFREWRRANSGCRGALIWFLRDLWPGSGWGVIDAHGEPKAPYYFLKRLLQPETVFFTDEGGSGLIAHVINERAEALQATLRLRLLRNGQIDVGTYRKDIRIEARGSAAINCVELLDGFADLNYAYRFGPPLCDVIQMTLVARDGSTLSNDCHFPLGVAAAEEEVGLTAAAEMLDRDRARISLHSVRVARYVRLQFPGFRATDQYFHLLPGATHCLELHRYDATALLRGEVRALNAVDVCRISCG